MIIYIAECIIVCVNFQFFGSNQDGSFICVEFNIFESKHVAYFVLRLKDGSVFTSLG